MMLNFDPDDIFLITGASSGIGLATARRINELGGNVVAVSRRFDVLSNIQKELPSPDRFYVEIKDIAKELDGLSSWVAKLAAKYGKLKGMVLSAGDQQILPLRSLNIKTAKELFDINYFANVELCKGFCDKRTNRGPGCSIVILSSIASITGNAGISNYSASKGAINSFVKALAAEVSRDKIRVNAVLPGFVHTDLVRKWQEIYTPSYIEELKKKYPLGIGQPEYVSDLIVFLLSSSAQWITGTNIVVDGGATLC